MEEEILLSGAVVFRYRGSKIQWLVVKPTEDDQWQLIKGVVRKGESSVRTVIRAISELAGIRGRVLEEAGRATAPPLRGKPSMQRRIVYYLVQQKGKSEEEKDNGARAQVAWAEFTRARDRLKTGAEKRMLVQARATLTEWQKQEVKNL